MTQLAPIHELRDNLRNARLRAIEELATKAGALPSDALQKLALLQVAYTAVEEEIRTHGVKVGGGTEEPLK